MLDKSILIGIGAVLAVMVIYYVKHRGENYASGNDLAWASGLPGNCNNCGTKNGAAINFSNPNLMADTLINSVMPQKVDYYNQPAISPYYGDALPDQLYGKLWGN